MLPNVKNKDSMDKEEIKQIAYDYTTCKADAKKLEGRILSLFSVSKQSELFICPKCKSEAIDNTHTDKQHECLDCGYDWVTK